MTRRLLPLLLLPLVACGSNVKTSDFEPTIVTEIERFSGAEVELDCPDDVEAKTGAKFRCTATAEDDTKAPVNITVTKFDADAEPPVDADWRAEIAPIGRIEADIVKQLTPQVGEFEVDCPDLVGPVTRFECDAESTKGERARIVVSGKSLDSLRYRAIPVDG